MAKSKMLQARVTERFMERVEKVIKFEGINKADLVTIAVKRYIEEVEERMTPD